jgi:replication factor A1
VEVNPDLTEAHQLRGWYDSQGGNVGNLYPISVSRGSGAPGSVGTADGGFASKPADKKFFAQVKEENLGNGTRPDYFEVKGTITLLKHDKDVWYTACPGNNCFKKVTEQSAGSWTCAACNVTYNSYVPRYDNAQSN